MVEDAFLMVCHTNVPTYKHLHLHTSIHTHIPIHPGMNGGVLLVRITPWSKKFLAEIAEYGIDWWHPKKESPFEAVGLLV